MLHLNMHTLIYVWAKWGQWMHFYDDIAMGGANIEKRR